MPPLFRKQGVLSPRERLGPDVRVRPLGLLAGVVLLVGDGVESEGEAGRNR